MKKSPNAGRSILEILWEELDSIMDRLMEDGEPNKLAIGQEARDAWKAYGEERGQAQGVAYCIAVMTNPYAPDIPAVKQTVVERWNERQQEQ